MVPHTIVVRLQVMPQRTCKDLVPRGTFHSLAKRGWFGMGGLVEMLGVSALRSARLSWFPDVQTVAWCGSHVLRGY